MGRHLFLPIFVIMMITSETRGGPGTPIEIRDNFITGYHNWYRSDFAKRNGVSNMRGLYWNDDMAKQAENYATECRGKEHSQDSKSENIYIKLTSAKNITDINLEYLAVQSWADERNIKGIQYNPYVHNPGYGHWTTMIWANLEEFGCGAARCKNYKKPKNQLTPLQKIRYYSYIVVCQYSPKTNIRGGSAFLTGPFCSDCAHSDYKCNSLGYPYLCNSF